MTQPNPTAGTVEHAAWLTQDRHPGVQTALAWLAYSHLPAELQTLSEPVYVAAWVLLARIPTDSAELTSALNKLVEAKDWMVRAGIRSDQGRPGPVPRPATEGVPLIDNRIGPNFGKPKGRLIGPPHAHLDGTCTEACYEGNDSLTGDPIHKYDGPES